MFQSETARLVALERVEKEIAPEHPEVAEIIDFIRNSERGVCPPRVGLPSTDPW